jgi:hypothetical protein
VVAETTSVSSSESDVSLLSPGGSPRVLDLPVSTDNSDEEDSVVEGGLAVAEDTGGVGAPVGGIDCDGDGVTVDSGVKGVTA